MISKPEDSATPVPPGASKAPRKPVKKKENTRDTFESILFAFVLAFLFRTFEAEAFVIPTGSMAPTLYGRHKESDCKSCGYHMVVGASHEVNSETGKLMPNLRLQGAVCPNCGYENDQFFDALAFNGDRILVNKYPYEFGDPDRWDVFVFKYPTEPQTNYIKRLVGLPGDILRIRDGNLYQAAGSKEEILRKQPDKQRALQIPVYDDDHFPRELVAAGWPERWAGVTHGNSGGVAGWTPSQEGWSADPQARTYSISAERAPAPVWLRYRHFFPTPNDWHMAEQRSPLGPQARLIGDFCGYNSTIEDHQSGTGSSESIDFGPFWVPDLTINFQIDIQAVHDQAELLIELCEGTKWYRCRIDPKTGAAKLQEVDTQFNERVKELAQGQTPLIGTGAHDVSFANVDDRLCLWIDGTLVNFGEGALLDSPGATGNPFPTDTDLTPVGIAATGLSATVSHLLLERDVYYRVVFPGGQHPYGALADELSRHVTDPQKWGETYGRFSEHRDIPVGPDEFLAFGDNSPQSNDSRMWDPGFETVPRKFLVGKAFWIYWPHGVPFLNNGRGYAVRNYYEKNPKQGRGYPKYTVPFYPQFWRMTRIR